MLGLRGGGALGALALAGVAVLGGCGPSSARNGGAPAGGGGAGDTTGGGGSHGGGSAYAGCATNRTLTPAPGTRVAAGTVGPWTLESCVYGAAAGVQEGWIVDATADEAQNRWIATQSALYLVTPSGAIRRYTAEDGLHTGAASGHPPGPVGYVKYCDMQPIPPDQPCAGELIWGGANAYGIRSVAGGAPNEVFVGYHGTKTPGVTCDGGPDWCDPMRHSGKVDRVRLNPDGTLTVDRFDNWVNDHALGYWHNRTPFRLLYDHVYHPGTLYEADDHGVLIVFPDRFVPYHGASKADLDRWLNTFLGDHLHAEVCYHASCAASGDLRAGDWRGLALDGQGRLWHAGQFTAGLVTWDPDPVHWWERWGAAFVESFGDPYVAGGGNEPVFKVPMEGDDVNLTAVAVCPDGRVWFASSGPTGVNDTVAVWTPDVWFKTFDARTLGLGERGVQDLVCLPDGRLVLAGLTSGAAVYDPATGASKPLAGLPGSRVLRLTLDTTVKPYALYVATDGGAAVLRDVP